MMKQFFILFLVTIVCQLPPQISSHRLAERIIGGDTANAGQFPFAAAVYKTSADGTFFCSGALIETKWVLTAGQCVDGGLSFIIRLGSNSLSVSDENTLTLSTSIYHLHPGYNPETLANDIGIIEFKMDITYTEYIKPVNVYSTNPAPEGTTVFTVGWGQISDDTAGLVDELRYVYLTTLSNEECKLVYGSQIDDNMICASGNYNEGTCKGDLGSPLIRYTGGGILTYFIGVSSFISSNGCESTDPSGFTRVSPYYEWISNITTSTKL